MCDPILVNLLKMQPHYSQSSRDYTTPSRGTSPLASYKELPPRGVILLNKVYFRSRNTVSCTVTLSVGRDSAEEN